MKVFVLNSYGEDLVYKCLDDAINETPIGADMKDGDKFTITCKEMSEEEFKSLLEW